MNVNALILRTLTLPICNDHETFIMAVLISDIAHGKFNF
jgi:hypothetical protein